MRRRIVRLSTAITVVAIALFGLPVVIGLTPVRRLRAAQTGSAPRTTGSRQRSGR